ncbi:MAG TPA: 6-pyruvoyl-tetrahydropterin synthase-related protein [Patescibacteria group bacterium]|nr:6-pyruvoyl-tetrahydropterin synthase-related protein [Patescibacteria group bacterium]
MSRKEFIFQVLFLILVGFIFLLPLINNSFYLTHDGQAQVARFGAYIKSFSNGEFPFRWAGDLNYRYGSPVLIFYYPLTGILTVPLYFAGISLESSFKLIIGASFILSFLSFFLWMRELTKKIEASLFGSILYGLIPYHFLNLYVRGDIAESLALALAPLIFYSIEKLRETRNIKYVGLSAILYALTILSHNSVSLLISPVILVYSILRSTDKKMIYLNLVSIVLGLGLSAFFWIPAIMESKYTNSHLFISDMYKDNFPSFFKLIYSSWGTGANVNDSNGLSPQIGIIPWIFVISSIFLVKKVKKMRDQFAFWLIVFFTSVFFTISYSDVFWKYIPLLSMLQFPWRIIGIASFSAAVIATLVATYINKAILYLLMLVVICYSIGFTAIKLIPSKTNSFYFNYPGTTYYHGQASSIWTAGDFGSYPKKDLEIISGKGKVYQIVRRNNEHSFRVDSKNGIAILDNTVFFPGWQVDINGQRVPIEFQDINHRGLITFKVPPGQKNVDIVFRESPLRLLSDLLSISGLFGIFIVLIFSKKIGKILYK